MDHFDAFDIPVQYYPDQKELSKRFKKHIMANHPDLNDGEDQAEVSTASINSAYKVLKNEQKRIAYMLQSFEQENKKEKKELDPMFLMEMMELNETLMESDDSTSLLEEVQKRDEEIWEEIKVWGLKHDQEGLSIEETYAPVKALFLQSNYMRRILENHQA